MSDNNEKMSLGKLEQQFFARTDVGEYDLNYCIPINVGILAQDFVPGLHGEKEIDYAVEDFGNELQKLFGTFAPNDGLKPDGNNSRNHLAVYVLAADGSTVTDRAKRVLAAKFHAEVRQAASLEEMKEKCWLVLALWDGVADGETYEQVKSILTDVPKKAAGAYKMTFPNNRPVFQIVLPAARQSVGDAKAEKNVENYAIRDIYPRVLEKPDNDNVWYDRYRYQPDGANKARRKRFLKSAKKMKKFNAATIDNAHKHLDNTENVYDLLPEYRQKYKLSLASEVAVLRQICYDTISMKAQEEHKFDLTAVLGFALLGLVFYSMYSDSGFVPIKIFIYIFIALFILAYFFSIFGSKLKGHQQDYLEFRALAECMRVQCYWYTAGIDESTGHYYCVKFNKDMSWAIYALDRWHEDDTVNNRVDFAGKDDSLICEEWIAGQSGQYNFFRKRIGEFEKKSKTLQTVTRVTKILWVIVAAALTLILIKYNSNENIWEKAFIFAIGLMNVVTLAASYISEKLAYKELVAKYTYCTILAEKAVDDFNSQQFDPKDIFKQYGEEALAENAEWLMIQNDREPDVPNG